jgi:hypothetical protein
LQIADWRFQTGEWERREMTNEQGPMNKGQ